VPPIAESEKDYPELSKGIVEIYGPHIDMSSFKKMSNIIDIIDNYPKDDKLYPKLIMRVKFFSVI
jgi:hypothetical protein